VTGATKRIVVGRHPLGVGFGFGSAWVANADDDTVSRVDPATDQVIATIRSGGDPEKVTVSGGRVWVTSGNSSITAVDPNTDRASFTLANAEDPSVDAGSLWAVGGQPPREGILQVDPVSGRILRDFDEVVPSPSTPLPMQVAAGEGTLWETRYVVNAAHPIDQHSFVIPRWPSLVARMFRIDPSTGATIGRAITVDGYPPHMVIAHGAVWMASGETGTTPADRSERTAPVGRETGRRCARSLASKTGRSTQSTLRIGRIAARSTSRELGLRGRLAPNAAIEDVRTSPSRAIASNGAGASPGGNVPKASVIHRLPSGPHFGPTPTVKACGETWRTGRSK
jgi:YVTN family beta-propeller protein